ncbi:STAS domain-containing protein [Trichlorobacter ammonificans]|uniref:Anti-anti-sigma factor n=1 Tax=Trichlorobacter ammonificans TaxID=2916410 RepID=A0ABM9DA45_9BACT|nr:STAS domain-containing protein [Trichlorobacter ammonificans]CAH2031230.1 Anti-anti-sigma factor [Trichlorobacter ammonificans]
MSDLTVSHTFGNDGQILVTIGGRLAIDTVAGFRAFLTEQLPQAATVKLDAASLEEIDLCGIQLICSACHTALCAGKMFAFSGGIPACVQTTISSLGLQGYDVCKYNSDITCIWCRGVN